MLILVVLTLYFIHSALKQIKAVAIVIILMIHTPKYVLDVAKDLNIKVFSLMSRANETKNIKWHETYKCECRLDAIVSNNKQRCNKNKCRCECKELIQKVYVRKILFGILVIVNVNVINHLILVSIYIIEIVNVKKGW